MIKGNGFFIPTEIGDFHPTLSGDYRPTLTSVFLSSICPRNSLRVVMVYYEGDVEVLDKLSLFTDQL